VSPPAQGLRARLSAWARRAKRDVLALRLGARDPRVPWHAKALAAATAAYALSPIDLIPDFVPVLGYLDDALLLPALVVMTVGLIPAPVMADLRAEAERRMAEPRPRSRAGAAAVVLLWIAGAALAAWWWMG
jgi:uncharacterized membrane protein YkvA (DUF1232 family)